LSLGLKANVDGSGAIQVGGSDAITLSTGLNATFVQNANLPNTFGFKNRIINGAMVIDQRNAGAAVTPTSSNTYLIDRFVCEISQSSKFSSQRNAGSVTPPTGYSNYLGITSLSAYSIVTGDYFTAGQRIEGYNLTDLAWGTASAATVTLSFWVRSSLTGTFGGAISNYNASRSYPFTYTISSANTWEQKTITIAGDTSGTWATDNGIGINLRFGLGVGATYSGTAGTWAATNYASATGATSVVGTSGATFYITGVQLEKGSTATSFDYRPYGTELALCQRYYYKNFPAALNKVFACSYNSSTTVAVGHLPFPVTMRTTPTALEQNGTANNYSIAYLVTSTACSAVPTFTLASTDGADVSFTVASGLTAGQASQIRSDITNGATAYLAWSAEL
jgi:hypothetical protein